MGKNINVKYKVKNSTEQIELKIDLGQSTTQINLKKILKKQSILPYNGNSKFLNCRGLGSCGTCAVSIMDYDGNKIYKSKEEYIENLTTIEKIRLNFFPHTFDNSFEKSLRLSCQFKVNRDLMVVKNDGFWGNK